MILTCVGVFIKIPFSKYSLYEEKKALFIMLSKVFVLRSGFTSENLRFNSTP